MSLPFLAYGTPRKLPKPAELPGRVVVLDVAFASSAGGVSFDKVTRPFIDGLGHRLAMWIDHHDHVMHAAYADDARFVLRTKAQHGACPELVTPERVAQAGPVQSICCHVDFDGLCSAAKWIREGEEPYPGADDDARAIDTRMGEYSERALVIDRALRARPKDDSLRGIIVRFLAGGAEDTSLFAIIRKHAQAMEKLERESQRLAQSYAVEGIVAVCDARQHQGGYDKTLLLMLGQERAPLSLVHDATTVTLAARFDSGVDLLRLLDLEGGMPTRVSVAAKELDHVLARLRQTSLAQLRGEEPST